MHLLRHVVSVAHGRNASTIYVPIKNLLQAWHCASIVHYWHCTDSQYCHISEVITLYQYWVSTGYPVLIDTWHPILISTTWNCWRATGNQYWNQYCYVKNGLLYQYRTYYWLNYTIKYFCWHNNNYGIL
jgi:hypothetical protein